MKRTATIKRDTNETSIVVSIDMDGVGNAIINTGIKFIDHLITSMASHGMLDLTVKAISNDDIKHHLIEDVAISMGQAIDKALGDRHGIVRFGHAVIPMDESLAETVLDLVKRQYYKITLCIEQDIIEDVTKEDLEHFFQSLFQNMNSCVHLTVRYGDNDHHKVEAAIKSLAVALRHAITIDEHRGIPSTKGLM